MSSLTLAVQSYDATIRLYNDNLRRKYIALTLYLEARHNYEVACTTGSIGSIRTGLLKKIKKDAALDFIAMSLITNEGLVAVDHAMYQIELIRSMESN